MSRFVKRKQYIGQLELLAAVAVYYSVPQWFRQRAVIHYVDNSSAVAALVKGYSSKPDSAKILHAFWALVAGIGALPWFYYVRSEANVGDFPSRDKEIDYLVRDLHAHEIEFIMPPFGKVRLVFLCSGRTLLQIIQQLKKSEKGGAKEDCYETLKLTKDDKRKELFKGLSLRYPINPKTGDFHLTCCFGNGSRSKCVVILSRKENPKISFIETGPEQSQA